MPIDPDRPIDPRVQRERERIGAIIRSLRLYRDLSQEALEHASGVSVRHIRRMESGTVSVGIDRYIRVSWALGVPLASLIADDWSTPLGDAGEAGAQPDDAPPVRQG